MGRDPLIPQSQQLLTPSVLGRSLLDPTPNPLLSAKIKQISPSDIPGPTVLARKRPAEHRRELRDARRFNTAREAIAGLTLENEIAGFTKAQFSLIDLVSAALEVTGPAHFSLATWTASVGHIARVTKLRDKGLILSARWLLDYTFARRDPAAAQQLRESFGNAALALTQNHAKYVLLRNDRWSLVIRTSMNLNLNLRFENFDIAHDPTLADFIDGILKEIWTADTSRLETASTAEQRAHFRDHL